MLSKSVILCYVNALVLTLHRRSLMFWSDTVMDTIKCANLNGENEKILVNSSIRAVGMLKARMVNWYLINGQLVLYRYLINGQSVLF